MFVKIMVPQQHGDPLAEIYETPFCRFETRPWNPELERAEGEAVPLAHYACMRVDGMDLDQLVPDVVYVLNDKGDTIDRWNPNFKPQKIHPAPKKYPNTAEGWNALGYIEGATIEIYPGQPYAEKGKIVGVHDDGVLDVIVNGRGTSWSAQLCKVVN